MERVKLGEIGTFATGGTPSRKHAEYFRGQIPWVTTVALNGGHINATDAQQLITDEAIQHSATKLIPDGSILVGIRVGIGKVAINDVPMCSNQDIVAISNIETDSWNIDYLCFAIQSQAEFLSSQKQGATISGISSKLLKSMEIERKPIEEQIHIVHCLERVRQQIALVKRMLAKTDELVQSRFVEMFGDPSDNPRGWEIARLNELGLLERGVSKHRPRNASELLGGPYPLIQTGDVAQADLYIYDYKSTYSELGLRQSKMQKKGTLCITIAANIAKTAILSFDACFPDSIVGFTPSKRIDTIFVHFWFSFIRDVLERQAPESAQKNINLRILRELSVIVPPIELQREFAAFVRQVESLKTDLNQQLDRLNTLYDSLTQRYFA